LSDDPAAVVKADPSTYVNAGDPPFLLMHGDSDKLVSPNQTLSVHTALRAAGVESTRYVITGAGHGDLGLPPGDADTSPWTSKQVTGYMVDFLKTHLAG
jgi:dipeptidyl aminopeptidase/acylaminoacyl peptidase